MSTVTTDLIEAKKISWNNIIQDLLSLLHQIRLPLSLDEMEAESPLYYGVYLDGTKQIAEQSN